MRLPPLNALRAFEAVCRHGSVLKAAEELGVVRGAVRQQIATLEAHFGVTLFERSGGRLVPTSKSLRLADAASTALAIIKRASQEFQSEGQERIRLGVPSAFAIWWLMPRLAMLQAAMGPVEIDIVPMTVVEQLSAHPELDAVIMGGEYRPASGVTAIRFMNDEFGPVATPMIAREILGNPAAMAGTTCLASRSAPSLWNEWFSESGTPRVAFQRSQTFEDLLLAIAAARSGLGVALAPRASIEDDLRRNLLVAPYGFVSRLAGYSLCCRNADLKRPAHVALREWLQDAGSNA
ncbi:LysR substrate-binding domain-containing protein [Rhizobium sp. S152]|uniref:LysR substrate-binding domain-containing protein n=1 Tax=Rhizobium sp. S152 TaxID=3055038 RepID=UPI0025A9F957|nr:LysR substrate-binding domain-containing protein [Rhizobium sp. S152]MDM9626492.1 LysR substrate-binding domain-containing protein [Rhizobium sp. S152]